MNLKIKIHGLVEELKSKKMILVQFLIINK